MTNYNLYLASHGKKPRGFGHWCFRCEVTKEEGFFSGSFSDAQRKAFKYFKGSMRSFDTLTVMP